MQMPTDRVALAQLPTPLTLAERLTAAWGGPRIWIKRDDLTGFGLSGNKVRKLEFHMAAARSAGADTFVTCGAVQSNHCRATAMVAAQSGFDCVLLLRSSRGNPPDEVVGNHFLQRLAGAEVRFIDRPGWARREELMAEIAGELAEDGRTAWVMPAGASDRWGVAAFAHAMRELDEQARGAGIGNATLWHASSSGGTTAGLALAAAASSRGWSIVGSSVGETRAELTETVEGLLTEAGVARAPYEIVDEYVGLGYGQTTDEELAVQVAATRLTGQVWDPTYTGKALYALRCEIDAGRFGPDDDVVFWHTGGGFAAFAHDYSGVL
ncbi:MAG: pyridoxal-phosphate dependent enzyme [Actinomycetota bacterium]